ncbi:MAG: ZIP family metal transporter, partial [Gemmatimonadota bacterium]|nr:ZIP family metal transporter [Gemmatimonadota bacterium]
MDDLTRLGGLLAITVLFTLAGGLAPLAREWPRATLRLLLAFGTGVLLGAAFTHMIPEAVGLLGPDVGPPVLAGFLLIYVLERFVMVHPCEEEGCAFHRMGVAAFIGITVHSLIDGLALGAAVAIPELSWAVAAAIILHKF